MEQLYVGDALLIADVQNDFLPGGVLGVKGDDEIVPVLRGYSTQTDTPSTAFVAARRSFAV